MKQKYREYNFKLFRKKGKLDSNNVVCSVYCIYDVYFSYLIHRGVRNTTVAKCLG